MALPVAGMSRLLILSFGFFVVACAAPGDSADDTEPTPQAVIVPPSLSKRTSYPENGLFSPEDTLYFDVMLLQTTEP